MQRFKVIKDRTKLDVLHSRAKSFKTKTHKLVCLIALAGVSIGVARCFERLLVAVERGIEYSHDEVDQPSYESNLPKQEFCQQPIPSIVRIDEWTIAQAINNSQFNEYAPQVDLIWSRGWYNAVPLPAWVSMEYYNSPIRGTVKTNTALMDQFFQPSKKAYTNGYIWIRRDHDLPYFVDAVLNAIPTGIVTNLTLITSDGDPDVPFDNNEYSDFRNYKSLLTDPRIFHWYSQNVAQHHPKLTPLPIGIDLHTPFCAATTPLAVIQRMVEVYESTLPLRMRLPMILYDKGQFDHLNISGCLNPKQHFCRRDQARTETIDSVDSCKNQNLFFRLRNRTERMETWKLFGSYQFGIAPTGIGWDTHRMWEFLFFKTIPIVKSSPLDLLLIPAHVPVIILEDWNELCMWNATNRMKNYGDWIENSHEWLKPILWIPQNQTRMDALCTASPGCWEVYKERKHLLEKWS